MKNYKHIYLLIYSHILLFNFLNVPAQQKLAPDIYMVQFTDKAHNQYNLSQPEQFLSLRAIERRTKQNIALYANDLPVSNYYVDSLKQLGFTILNQSKWLNAVSVNVKEIQLLNKLNGISFINSTNTKSAIKSISYNENKFDTETISEKYTPQLFNSQITIHHGEYLHNQGFRGQGMLIAVIDAGFNNAQNMNSLASLWNENRVKLVRDIIVPHGDVYKQDNHGAYVLSILAGLSAGNLTGSAPNADYVLLRSENAVSEYPIEEFDWAVAAELSDSIGADIINSSLGYTTFLDSQLNHSYADMNGRTAIVSKVATSAAQKGMIVVVSAGNDGDKSWKYISAPADADSVLTVGAIDANAIIADFSSRGPTADHRVKPDVVAVGWNTFFQLTDNTFAQGNGTSFSAPVIAGLTACLWQAHPTKTNMEIIRAIQQSSSQYASPDSIKGYGVPNFEQTSLSLNREVVECKANLICAPNPFANTINLKFNKIPEGTAQLTVVDMLGRKVFQKQLVVNNSTSNTITTNDLSFIANGQYIITIVSGSTSLKAKITKLEK